MSNRDLEGAWAEVYDAATALLASASGPARVLRAMDANLPKVASHVLFEPIGHLVHIGVSAGATNDDVVAWDEALAKYGFDNVSGGPAGTPPKDYANMPWLWVKRAFGVPPMTAAPSDQPLTLAARLANGLLNAGYAFDEPDAATQERKLACVGAWPFGGRSSEVFAKAAADLRDLLPGLNTDDYMRKQAWTPAAPAVSALEPLMNAADLAEHLADNPGNYYAKTAAACLLRFAAAAAGTPHVTPMDVARVLPDRERGLTVGSFLGELSRLDAGQREVLQKNGAWGSALESVMGYAFEDDGVIFTLGG